MRQPLVMRSQTPSRQSGRIHWNRTRLGDDVYRYTENSSLHTDYNWFDHMMIIPHPLNKLLGVPTLFTHTHPYTRTHLFFSYVHELLCTGILSRKIVVVALSRGTLLSCSTVRNRGVSISRWVPSGNFTVCCGTSHFLMGHLSAPEGRRVWVKIMPPPRMRL